MCVCSFDMLFTYVMSGWEGSANDSRILQECIKNPENKFPMPKRDQYYLVDSGYSNMPGFLAPFRGQRYHLRDFRERRHRPRGREEVFNYRHSSLRNVIERCFGVLKARFPILKQMPPYPIKTQKYIPIACCIVHNYIRLNDRQDDLFNDFSNELMIVEDTHNLSANLQSDIIELDVSRQHLREMARARDDIANQIWATFEG
ncbi:hypothetical protein IC575_029030 [Cucumis melo]